jgi:hypothetical protein
MEVAIFGHASNAGLLGKSRRGLENATFMKMGFNIRGHGEEWKKRKNEEESNA